MYQILLTTDGSTEALSEVIADGNEAEHQLVEHASLRIWNFDEYTTGDIEQIIEDGEVHFGGHRLFIEDIA